MSSMKDLVTVEEIVSMLEGYWRFSQREEHRRSVAEAIATFVAARWAKQKRALVITQVAEAMRHDLLMVTEMEESNDQAMEHERKVQELVDAAIGYVEFDLANGTTADFCAAGDRLRAALAALKVD